LIARGVAQVIELLPSKYKALTSNPNTSKKQKTSLGLEQRGLI
jgi:hypothetical protein